MQSNTNNSIHVTHDVGVLGVVAYEGGRAQGTDVSDSGCELGARDGGLVARVRFLELATGDWCWGAAVVCRYTSRCQTSSNSRDSLVD